MSAGTDALAEPLFGANDIRVRPIIGYAQFAESEVVGDVTGNTHIRTKKEDVIGGIAASISTSWDMWRAELEYSWRVRTDLNAYIDYPEYQNRIRNNLESQAATLNFFRYFDPVRGFQPYVTAGGGVVRHTSDADYTSTHPDHIRQELTSTEIRHTWNAGAGLIFETDSGWAFDVGYRYVDLGEASTATFSDGISLTTGAYTTHDIALTIRKIF